MTEDRNLEGVGLSGRWGFLLLSLVTRDVLGYLSVGILFFVFVVMAFSIGEAFTPSRPSEAVERVLIISTLLASYPIGRLLFEIGHTIANWCWDLDRLYWERASHWQQSGLYDINAVTVGGTSFEDVTSGELVLNGDTEQTQTDPNGEGPASTEADFPNEEVSQRFNRKASSREKRLGAAVQHFIGLVGSRAIAMAQPAYFYFYLERKNTLRVVGEASFGLFFAMTGLSLSMLVVQYFFTAIPEYIGLWRFWFSISLVATFITGGLVKALRRDHVDARILGAIMFLSEEKRMASPDQVSRKAWRSGGFA